MVKLVDTTHFPVGRDIDYESKEEVEALRTLTSQAQAFVEGWDRTRPVESLRLAFGVGPIIGLYLVRFEPDGEPEDREQWVVVGDLPSMHFKTDNAPEPWVALKLYCAMAQDWADNIRNGRDLSDSYPIDAAPTAENAQLLLSRIAFIRTKLIPLTQPSTGSKLLFWRR